MQGRPTCLFLTDCNPGLSRANYSGGLVLPVFYGPVVARLQGPAVKQAYVCVGRLHAQLYFPLDRLKSAPALQIKLTELNVRRFSVRLSVACLWNKSALHFSTSPLLCHLGRVQGSEVPFVSTKVDELQHMNHVAKVTSSRNDLFDDYTCFVRLSTIIITIRFRRRKGRRAVIGVCLGYAGCAQRHYHVSKRTKFSL